MTRCTLLIFIALTVLAPVQRGEAQRRRSQVEDLCVDQVDLKIGPTLYGAILGHSEDGTLTMAVRREWLRTKSKSFYAKQTESEAADSVQALKTLRDRIDVWLKASSDHKLLSRFLREQLELVEQKLTEAKDNPGPLSTEFMLIEIPERQVRKGYSQPESHRWLALAAWKLNLKDVEEKNAEDLEQELNDRKVDLAQLDLDLSNRLPVHVEGEREWAARRAIVEHHFWRSMEFQGTERLLFETGAGAGADQPELIELLPQILNQELTKQLGDLLGEPGAVPKPGPDPIEKATKQADEKQVSAVVITRLDQSLTEKRVSVEKLFLAKMPDGQWQRVWRHVVTLDASKQRKEIEEELANHEQIKQIRNTFKSLGLLGGEDHLTTAIRFGAATMEAQQKSAEAFDTFEKRYVRSLDGPPLIFGGP